MGEATADQILLEEAGKVIDIATRKPVPSTGGTGGGDNWLSKLKAGDVFLAKANFIQPQFMLTEFSIGGFLGKACMLANVTKQDLPFYVDPADFSQHWTLFEMVTLPEE